MLEIKNLSKIYKTNNVTTKALDNVSLKFPDKGMVFLLGKSGSGKSTLLNVCGGLDTPTDGEIIVKGRSSSSFSGSDFDSYRNTYIGFIFQEYNILNEFTVEDNIALALELQGKSKDRNKINELLAQVDLADFARRRPNTLSGGQKQRIAIARALIKDPEIIMADEPTGALDSNTGKQVLDTLKKLSESKLVIVVSHDREFAEYYGDRIIELKDGQILSDTSKTTIEAKHVGHITMVDDNTISIKNGVELTNDDIKALNDFLKKSNNEILISNNEKDIKEYKQQAKISDSGLKETFIETNEDCYKLKQYSKEEAKLIRSKLPMRHAAKIGTSNLKLKPIRLIFTILLSVVSFILLGIVSTMTFYDKNEVSIESFMNSNLEYIPIQKGYQMTTTYTDDDYSYTSTYATFLSESDINNLKSTYGNETIFYYDFNSAPSVGEYYYSNGFKIQNVNLSNNEYYSAELGHFAYANKSHSIRSRIIAGSYPKNDDEILISSYTYDSIKIMGLRDTKDKQVTINNPRDICNKTIILNSNNGQSVEYKISGVYNVDDLIPEQYKELAEESSSYNSNSYYWQEERRSGIYTLGFVTEGFYEANKSKLAGYNYKSIGKYTDAPITLGDSKNEYNNIAKFGNETYYNLNGSKLTNPNKNDIVLSSSQIMGIIYDYLAKEENSEIHDKFYQTVWDDEKEEWIPSISEKTNIFTSGESYNYSNTTEDNPEPERIIHTEEERLAVWEELYNFLYENNATHIFENISMDQPSHAGATNVNIAGFAFINSSVIFMNEELYDKYYFTLWVDNSIETTKYVADENAYISGALIYNTKNYNDISKLIDSAYTINSDDSLIVINCSIMNSLEMVNSFIEDLTIGFLWGGIILAIFATLLLFNFISVSITNKKREIGILRAVGARGLDVFKIFFSESVVIVAICCVIAIVGSIVTCNIINNAMGEGLAGVRLLVFGLPSIILIIILSILVSFLSTFLPVYSIAKKKPVESIRAI
ncbi:MAG: ATP-binding cassette domain-containing protein [Erysipelotrichaceae bacterium]|nr:ATP-binding cassette domain-containing protein [Erysipelotrichaceae bacterium]